MAGFCGQCFVAEDLRERNFRDADLSGVDFTEADLSGICSVGANLSNAILIEMVLLGQI